jgi:membrane-associated phospholipid phosphatase
LVAVQVRSASSLLQEPATDRDSCNSKRKDSLMVLIAAALAVQSWLGAPRGVQPGAAGARPADSHRLEWRPEWRRVGPPEYILTPLLGAGILALRWSGAAEQPNWSGPILHDDWTRDRLRLSTRSGRATAGTVSDALDFVAAGHVFLVDNLAVTALGDSNPTVAWQMLVINVQAYATAVFANRLTKRLTARARPYVEPCRADPDYDDNCGSESSFHSFYSGHATSSATSAGLICAHHTHLPLYGGGAADTAACLVAIGFTTATGALRISSDNHWATDVLVGHVSGYLAGYLLPTFLYYRKPQTSPVPEAAAVRATGFVLPRGDGVDVGVIGVF